MTNAEKFKEVFGYELLFENGICYNMSRCSICQYNHEGKCDEEGALNHWNNEYKEPNHNTKSVQFKPRDKE